MDENHDVGGLPGAPHWSAEPRPGSTPLRPTACARASELLTEWADDLRTSCTRDDAEQDWSGEEEAKVLHDELLDVAARISRTAPVAEPAASGADQQPTGETSCPNGTLNTSTPPLAAAEVAGTPTHGAGSCEHEGFGSADTAHAEALGHRLRQEMRQGGKESLDEDQAFLATLSRNPQPEEAVARDAETPTEKQRKLLELADRIDHEKLWAWAGMDHHKMTPEQRDRMNAGVALRRYANLWAPGRWVVFPPVGPTHFSASTLDKAVEMAKRDEARAALSRDAGGAK